MKKQPTIYKENKNTDPMRLNDKFDPQKDCRKEFREQSLLLNEVVESGNVPAIDKFILKWCQVAPNDPLIDCIRGMLLLEMGLCVPAIRILRRAVKRIPDSPDPKTTLGMALVENGDLEEAEQLQEEALAMDPNSFTAAIQLACTLLRRRKNLKRVEQLLRHADKLQPDFDALWVTLGHVLISQGRQRAAYSAFLRAIQLDKNGHWCRLLCKHFPHLAAAAKRRLKQLQ